MKKILYIIAILFAWTGSVWGQTPTFVRVHYQDVSCYELGSSVDGELTVLISDLDISKVYEVALTRNNFYWRSVPVTGVEEFLFENNGLPAGTYRVQVSIENSIELPDFSLPYPILEPSKLDASISKSGDCDNDAKITVTVNRQGGYTGDLKGFDYLLKDSEDNTIISGISNTSFVIPAILEIGTYSVTLTDHFTCLPPNDLKPPHTITQPVSIQSTKLEADEIVTSRVQPKCEYEETGTGSARITITGGIAGTVSVNGNVIESDYDGIQTQFTITGLKHGNNVLNITTTGLVDGVMQTCTYILTVTLEAPPAPKAEIVDTEDPCYEQTNGTITVQRTGTTGTGFFTFSIAGKPNLTETTGSVTFTGFGEGSYTVTGVDGNNCPVTITGSPVTLTEQPQPFEVDITDPDCFYEDPPTGKIEIINIPSAYTLSEMRFKLSGTETRGWIQYPQDLSFDELSPGTYTVTVEIGGSGGCEWDYENIVLEEPLQIVLTHGTTDDVTCNGFSDGKIPFTITPGDIDDYDYFTSIDKVSWDDVTTSIIDNKITGLPAGTYYIKATQKTGKQCESEPSGAITIIQPDALEVSATAKDLSCFNMDPPDGSITVTAQGGNLPYTFKINSEIVYVGENEYDKSFTQENLPDGLYTYTVEDAKGCPVDIYDPFPASVKIKPQPEIFATISQDNFCLGETVTLTATVNLPLTGDFDFKLNNGEWVTSNSFEIYPVVTGADHTISVRYRTDGDLCLGKAFEHTLVIASVTIDDVEADDSEIICHDDEKGKITVSASGGFTGGKYWYSINDGDDWQEENEIFENLGFDVSYYVKVKSVHPVNGECYSETWREIRFENPEEVTFTAEAVKSELDCSGDVTSIIISTTYSQWEMLYKLEKSTDNGLTYTTVQDFTLLPANEFTNLTAATYRISGKNEKDCPEPPIVLPPITITQPSPVEITNHDADPSTCYNGNDARITSLTATGGTGDYDFYISNDEGQSWTEWQSGGFDGLTGGATYHVMAMDEIGCESQPPYYEVEMPNQIEVKFTASAVKGNLDCAGDITSIIISTSYTQEEMLYKLEKSTDHGVTYETVEDFALLPSKEFENLTAATYRISGKNEKGCPDPPIVLPPITISEPAPIVVNVDPNPIFLTCLGDETYIRPSGSGVNSGNYRYQITTSEGVWDGTWLRNPNNTSQIHPFNHMKAGTYWIRATEWITRGNRPGICRSEPLEVKIFEPQPLSINGYTTTEASCLASDDGTITLSVSGGTYPDFEPNENTYIYTINSIAIEPDKTDVSNPVFTVGQGTYNISVRYNSACPAASVSGILVGYEENLAASIIQTPVLVTCHTDDVTLTVDVTKSVNDWDVEYQLFRFIDGGNGPITGWVPEDEFEGFDVQSSGTYTIQVRYTERDPQNACALFTAQKIVTIPDPLTITAEVTNGVSCTGDDDGEITVTAHDGYQAVHPIKAKYQFRITPDKDILDWREVVSAGDDFYVFGGLSPEVEYTFEVRRFYSTDGGTIWIETCPGLTYPYTNKTLVNPPLLTISEDITAHVDILCPNEVDPQTGSFKVVADGGTPDSSPNEYTYTLFKYNFDTLVDDFEPTGIVNSTGLFAQLDSGKYMVKATDKKNCPAESEPIKITRPEKIEFTLDVGLDIEDCNPIATLEIKIDDELFSKHSFVYRFTESTDPFLSDEEGWADFGNTNPVIINGVEPESIYIVQLAYAGISCTVFDEKTKTTLELPELKIEISNKIENECFGYFDAEFSFTSTLPAGTVYTLSYRFDDSFQWVDQSTYSTVVPLVPFKVANLYNGFYKISAIANGCPYESEEIDLSKPYIIGLDPDKPPQLLNPCSDSSKDGEIQIWIIGGTPDYTYNLHTKTTHPITGAVSYPQVSGQQNKTDGKFTDLPAGTYYVRIVDNFGCDSPYLPLSPDGGGITLGPAAQLTIDIEDENIDITHIYCIGEVGSAKVTVSGGRPIAIVDGKPIYNYVWKIWSDFESDYIEVVPAITDNEATTLEVGNYKVIVTDACNNTGENVYVEFEIEDHTLKIIESTFKNGISCAGEPEGSITIKTTGGIDTSGDRYIYEVTKKDDPSFDPGNYTVDISEDPDDGEEVYTIFGLEDGEYTIKVMDTSGKCWVTETDEIENPMPLEVGLPTRKDVRCNDDYPNGGSIRIAFVGGNAPYTVTLFDDDGVVTNLLGDECKIEGLDEFTIHPFVDFSPFGGDSIVVTITNLSGGSGTGTNRIKSYTVVVEEERENGCEWRSTTIGISNPRSLTAAIKTIDDDGEDYDKDFICPDTASDIYLTTEVRGEQATYTTTWWIYDKISDVFIANPAFNNSNPAPSGKYYAVVDDGICPPAHSNTIIIRQYVTLSVAGYPTEPALCETPGKIIILNPQGGIDEDDLFAEEENMYEFSVYKSDDGINWTEIRGFQYYPDDEITGLAAGKYKVEMKHGNIGTSCVPSKWIPSDLSKPEFIEVESDLGFKVSDFTIAPDPPSCFNTADGKITITPPAGNFEYNLTGEWMTLEEVNNLTLIAGTYTLAIREMTGLCEDYIQIPLGINLPQIVITIINEDNPYNPNCDENDDLGYTEGYIEFEVTLSEGVDFDFDDVDVPIVDNVIRNPVVIADNGVANTWRKYRAYLIDKTANDISITVKITDSDNGCEEVKIIKDVVYPQPLTLTASQAPQASCNSETIDVTFTIAGGEAPYQIFINDEPVSATVALPDDIYTNVYVEDKNGCRAYLNEPLVIDIITPEDRIDFADGWYNLIPPACFNDNGKIELKIPFGITGSFTYGINGEVIGPVPGTTDISDGTYTLWIYDESGCGNHTDFEISIAHLPKVTIENISDLLNFDCKTGTGTIEIEVELIPNTSGLTFDDLIVICNGADATPIPGQPGKYRAELDTDGKIAVTVTGFGDGCSAYDDEMREIKFPEQLKAKLSEPKQEQDGCNPVTYIDISIEGGSEPYKSILFNGKPITITDMRQVVTEPGTYKIEVIDAEDCNAEDEIEVKAEDVPEIFELKDDDIDIQLPKCNPMDSPDGSIQLPGIPAGSDYRYEWAEHLSIKPGQEFQNKLPDDTYYVTVYHGSTACGEKKEIRLKAITTIEVEIDDVTACPDGIVPLTGKVTVDGNVITGANKTDVYADWILPDGTIADFFQDIPYPFPSAEGKVELMARKDLCSNSAIYDIVIQTAPKLTFDTDIVYIPQDEIYTLKITEAENYKSWEWTFNGSPWNKQPAPTEDPDLDSNNVPYTLTLTLTGENGCTISKSVDVDLAIDLFIPNAFTPDGDDVHDRWEFRNIDKYLSFYDVQVSVSTRTGVPVFERNGYNNSIGVAWDGRRNGNDLPIGTYYYVVKLVPKSSTKSRTQVLTGTVAIIR